MIEAKLLPWALSAGGARISLAAARHVCAEVLGLEPGPGAAAGACSGLGCAGVLGLDRRFGRTGTRRAR